MVPHSHNLLLCSSAVYLSLCVCPNCFQEDIFRFSFEANIRLLALELKAVSIWSYVLSRDANLSCKHAYSSFTLVQAWAAPLQYYILRGLCTHEQEGGGASFWSPTLRFNDFTLSVLRKGHGRAGVRLVSVFTSFHLSRVTRKWEWRHGPPGASPRPLEG